MYFFAVHFKVKVLLLGAGESGKSTFLKQMRIIHGINFEPELVREYQHVIYQNLVKGMQVLVDAREIFNIPWTNPKRQLLAQQILGIQNVHELDIRLFRHCAPIIHELWQDQAIKDAYDRRREFQIVSKKKKKETFELIKGRINQRNFFLSFHLFACRVIRLVIF